MDADKEKEVTNTNTELVSPEEIEICIAILDKLGENAHQILELPEEKIFSKPSKISS